MPRTLLTAAAAAAALTLAAPAGPAHAAPVHASRNCTPPKYPGSGYFTSLRVRGTSCAAGKSLALAHYRCRIKHGKAGRCGSVLGFRCSEQRTTISTEIDSIVTCRKGTVRIVFSYQQNT